MKKILLNAGWSYTEAALQNPLLVNLIQDWKTTDLPHDYSVEKGRAPDSHAGLDEGFFQGAGLYYKKSFVLSEKAADKACWLEFEGIAGVAEIWVNKALAGKHMNPYTSLLINVTSLLHPGENEIMLHVDSRMKPNSRWYVGTGLYRNVWLYVGESSAAHPHGVKAWTESLTEDEALLRVQYALQTDGAAVAYALMDQAGHTVATANGADATMRIPSPQAWSPDCPTLYTLKTSVTLNGQTDVSEEKIGIRTIQVSAQEGLKLNGQPIKLRGGCIHHDLGLLGAADFEAAEIRRIKKLKESGFNAVRLAHNPFGPAIFNVCDALGMLAVEEAFDEWVLGRTSFGLHITFEDRWERDLEDMIRRDFNHPSILMWGTGNEVEERDGSADGFTWARKLADKVKALDPTRPVTASACALFSEYGQRPADGTTGNQALNMAFDNFASGNDIWGDTTAPYFAPLDVAGYNYKNVRYAHDAKKFPNRVIYGSESYPRATFQTWQDTVENNNVIGDFVWTAWDYLGEVGVGRWEVSSEDRPGNPAWPWMLAFCSDIDLIGEKRPQSYYRDAVWACDNAPHLFCLPPQLTGKHIARLSWGWLPVERSYTFPRMEGQAMEAHVYAHADEVELLLNGVSLGRKACGKAQEYQAVFTFDYVPGSLEAVAYCGGSPCGRDRLQATGSAAKLAVSADKNTLYADGQDLLFLMIQATDEQGLPVWNCNDQIQVSVENGVLQALGNADPVNDELHPFTQNTCKLYHGQALAVIRSKDQGEKARVQVKGLEGASAEIEIALTQPASEANEYFSEITHSAVDETIGTLLESEAVKALLTQVMPEVMNNPMLSAMKGMSLRKLMSMGGQSIPDALRDTLDQAWAKGGQSC